MKRHCSRYCTSVIVWPQQDTPERGGGIMNASHVLSLTYGHVVGELDSKSLSLAASLRQYEGECTVISNTKNHTQMVK